MTSPAGGVGHLARGFGMWRRRPRLMLLGMLPALLVFLVLFGLWLVLLWQVDDLVGWGTPFADDWSTTPRTVLRVGLMLALLAATGVMAAVVFVGLTLAVGDPFYERIWRETELMLGGPVPDRGPGFWRSTADSVAFGGLVAACGALVLVVGFLPVVGPVLGPVVGLVLSGRLLAAELLTRPLEARGLDRDARRELIRRSRGGVVGFGVATQLFFLVPLGAIVVMPAAVVGSTTLARDLLGRAEPPG